MNLNSKRIEALVKLGSHLLDFNPNDKNYSVLQEQVKRASESNGWFTKRSIEETFKSWGTILSIEYIITWLKPYLFSTQKKSKKIALILAGNIPMVGFHDIISVWVCEHKALVKCASKDLFLLPYMTDFLTSETGEDFITYETGKLIGFDAVIATGSNNAARYFDHYFSSYPHIIRKNRNGIAVIEGNETNDEMIALGKDMLQFFGLGCRNVSKVFLPKGYKISTFMDNISSFDHVIENNKYKNNFDYNLSIYLLNKEKHWHNDFLIMKESNYIASPCAVLFFEFYAKK